jgi:O-antigen ligase
METQLVKFFEVLEKGFVVLALLLLTGPRGTETLAYGIYPITFLLIVVRWKGIVRISIREKLLWVFIGLVLVSVLWSAAPKLTLIRSVTLLGTTLFGTYLAGRYSLNEQLRLLACALGIEVLLSFLFALALPEYGIVNDGLHNGAWQGITTHKNAFGRHMDISALVFLLLAMSSRRHRWLMWAGFSLSVSLVLLSTSKTALIIFLTILSLFPLYRSLRWSYTWMVPFLITVVLAGGSLALLLVSNAETIVAAIGRDLSLTGRTDLWAAVIAKIWERPWFGYGYGGFWLKWEGESADIFLITGWEPPHSHNGLLEIWLALGLVGVLIFVPGFLIAYLRTVAWVRSTNSATGLWPMVYLTLMFLINLTESTFGAKAIFWALYVATLLSTHNNPASKTEKITVNRGKKNWDLAKPLPLKPGFNNK